MVRQYLGKAWEKIEGTPHKHKIAYFVLGPGGTVVVPAYYGIKALQQYFSSQDSSSGDTCRGTESNLKDIVNEDS